MVETLDLFSEAEALARGLGYELVEFTLSRHRSATQVRAVIYRPSGVGIRECTEYHRALAARLQVLLGEVDPYLEVSSPGTERTIKDRREYRIFCGRGLRAYLRSKGEWVSGIVVGQDEAQLFLENKEGRLCLPFEDIAKARLDSSQEVR